MEEDFKVVTASVLYLSRVYGSLFRIDMVRPRGSGVELVTDMFAHVVR
jgi:hypothetical protein